MAFCSDIYGAQWMNPKDFVPLTFALASRSFHLSSEISTYFKTILYLTESLRHYCEFPSVCLFYDYSVTDFIAYTAFTFAR